MFTYKYCPKCSRRNHKTKRQCVRCGDQLTAPEKFGKDVFAIVLSLIVLFSSASVFASRSYFINKTNNSTPPVIEAIPQEQNNNVQPTQEVAPQPVETTTPTPSKNTAPAQEAKQPEKELYKVEKTDYSFRIPEFEAKIATCNLALSKSYSILSQLDAGLDHMLKEIEDWYNSQPLVDKCYSSGPRVTSCSTGHSDEDIAERQRRIEQANTEYHSIKASLNSDISDIKNYRIPSLEWIIDGIRKKELFSDPETYSFSTCDNILKKFTK